MEDTQNYTKPLVRVEAYNIADFTRLVQELVQNGYVVDFESNYGYPKHFMTSFSCTMLKVQEDKAEEILPSPAVTIKTPKPKLTIK